MKINVDKYAKYSNQNCRKLTCLKIKNPLKNEMSKNSKLPNKCIIPQKLKWLKIQKYPKNGKSPKN